jgi:hypothetical protein
MRRILAAMTLTLALAAAPARAHEQGDRALGVVESVTPEQLVVKASDGHLVTFAITRETRFLQGEREARPEDVRVGQRVVVQGRTAGGRLEAVRVRLGTSPPG